MSRIKYYYDTKTCKYERYKPGKWDVFLNVLGFFTLAAILAVGIVVIQNAYFPSPQVAKLKKENREMEMYYSVLEKEMNHANEMLKNLQQRDDHVYRTIFEAEPIPSSIRQAGVGGTKRYKNLLEEDLEREELIVNTFSKVDKLKRQMYIQTKSYDEILELAHNKSKMLSSIPAIQPISNKKLSRLASGYGRRIHPIYKVKMMHTGIDFSAPKGTPIYATGAGKVSRVSESLDGYGNQIEIDHGFGFTTKYAHMKEFDVERGEKVKRGDCIGYVGNTGISTGPHLHYEVIKNNKKVNPIHYFFQDLNSKEYEKLVELASVENQSLGM